MRKRRKKKECKEYKKFEKDGKNLDGEELLSEKILGNLIGEWGELEDERDKIFKSWIEISLISLV